MARGYRSERGVRRMRAPEAGRRLQARVLPASPLPVLAATEVQARRRRCRRPHRPTQVTRHLIQVTQQANPLPLREILLEHQALL